MGAREEVVHAHLATQTTAKGTAADLIEEIISFAGSRTRSSSPHNYQIAPIQDLADFVGDSLGSAQAATKVDAPTAS